MFDKLRFVLFLLGADTIKMQITTTKYQDSANWMLTCPTEEVFDVVKYTASKDGKEKEWSNWLWGERDYNLLKQRYGMCRKKGLEKCDIESSSRTFDFSFLKIR